MGNPMTYCTASDYLTQFGVGEATMLLQDEQHRLEQDWLVALIQNDPSVLAMLDGVQLAVVDGALARLNQALTETTRLMNGYLRGAGLALPLTVEQVAQTPLSTCNAELARCWLMDDTDNATDLAEKRCEYWRTWLRDIAARRVSLLSEQTDTNPAGTYEVRSGRGLSRFDHDWKGYPV